jgi:hypothetical protein
MVITKSLYFCILFAFWRFYFEGQYALRAKSGLKFSFRKVVFIVEDEIEILQWLFRSLSLDGFGETLGNLHSFMVLFY